jgi:nucleotide-binding universal stress UspA family protein
LFNRITAAILAQSSHPAALNLGSYAPLRRDGDSDFHEAHMAVISKILFPVDFSPSCVAMAAYVRRAATVFGAKISLAYVVDLMSHNALELYVRQAPDISEEHLQIGREKLDSFLAREFPVADCPRLLASGDAATEIAQLARDGKFDLIIMPTHAGRFRRMLLGSTTSKVLNEADCPVLTSQHAETISPRPLAHREVLCAIDLSTYSRRVLGFASNVADEANCNLTIIHAVKTQESPRAEHALDGECPSNAESEARRRIVELQGAMGTDAAVHIAAGNANGALLEAARQSDADVLMMGRSPQSGTFGRMRDLTYAMARDSPCPVLSI